MAGSLGQIAAKIVLDSREAIESLEKFARLAGVSKAKLTELVDVARQQGAVSGQVSTGINALGSAHDQTAGKTVKGADAARQFFREQRTQDRIVRESTQALFGLTLGLQFLASNQDKAGGSSKQFIDAITAGVATMQSAEFALFGMERAGKSLGGTFGNLMAKIGGMGGMISTVLGVGAALIMFFRKADEEAQKAADEGVKAFSDALEKLGVSTAGGRDIEQRIRFDISDLNKQLSEMTPAEVKIKTTRDGDFAVPVFSAAQQEERKELEKKRDMLKGIVDHLSEKLTKEAQSNSMTRLANQYVGVQVGLIEKLKAEVDELGKAAAKATDPKKVTELTDQRAAKEKELADLTKTTADRQKEQQEESRKELEVIKLKFEMGKASFSETRSQIEKRIQSSTDETEKLSLQRELTAMIEERETSRLSISEQEYRLKDLTAEEYQAILVSSFRTADSDEKRLAVREKILSVVSEEGQRIKAIEEAKTKDELAVIENVYNRRRREEEIQHLGELGRLQKLGADQSAIDAEVGRSRKAMSDIERDEARELASIRIQSVRNEEQRMRMKFLAERRLIDESADSAELKAAKIAELERNHENDLHQMRMGRYDEIISEVDRVGQALHRAFSQTGDEFLQKLFAAFQIATQIAKQLEAIRMAGGFEDAGAGKILGLATSLLGITGLFDSGGYTGKGRREEVAGVVHRGEIVFEKPIVDQHKDELLNLRSALQRGYRDGGLVLPSFSAPRMTQETAGMIMPIPTQQAPVTVVMPDEFVVSGKVDIDNGELFLRKRMPKYEQFRRGKGI